ncbi:energy-coupling factor transporter transmembrane protein EcfT [Brevibacterium sp. 91QC2O2]|uniref:energy-coupling factor transporter transmembrane component T family protein n=1 Tax=Brevibacterium TaxID=1696 RepID=UPI00211D1277|nr:energy-coupling factor transporter transmembrane protein EcfT [Brevibacterium sp. 91QC2O2]MCQ9385855.1 energy-coupling factor transporter transmembrane protein EcfT [Brevibacterium sp. 68QC2CO]
MTPQPAPASTPTTAPRLHPATQVLATLCALFLVFGVSSPLVPAAVIVAAGCVAAASRSVRLRTWAATLAFVSLPVLVMTLIIQGLFYPGERVTVLWSAGPAHITVEGLAIAVQLWLRVAGTVAVSALFALGSDSARLFDALVALRVPVRIAQVCASALGLAGQLGAQTRALLAAHRARGWDTSRLRVRLTLLPGLLAALFTGALVQMDQRQVTLAQRGLGHVSGPGARRPGSLQDHADSPVQRACRWIMPVLVLALIIASSAHLLPLPTATRILEVLGV